MTGAVIAHGTATKTGAGVYDVTPVSNADAISFAQVSTDLEVIKTQA